MGDIVIKTRLDEAIGKRLGGGQTVEVKRWKATPGKLVRAARALHAERRVNRRCYGNVGCGRSWLEIDGQEIAGVYLSTLRSIDDARDLLEYVASGAYAKRMQEEREEVDRGWHALVAAA